MSQKFTSYVSLYGIGASFRRMLFYLKALWKEEIAIEVCMDEQKLAMAKE